MPAKFSCFVTGTDTGVGKTRVSTALLWALAATGRRVAGMKPVASGCEPSAGALRSADALALLEQSIPDLVYEDVNPVALRDAIAPHIAIARSGTRVDLEGIGRSFKRLQSRADAVVVEGIGGWRVPFQDGMGTSDLVRELSLPVLLVVGLRLGCINHALLSSESIHADAIRLIGWIANQVDPVYGETSETVNYLSEQIPAPLLGCIPHLTELSPELLAPYIAIDLLVNP
ncbi:MAG: dethiobiotin synthase [Gammaproteobacteria bacterium]